ncbi:uncharacterized protein RCC_05034 [Ramularia collo-cygni]|uniref:Uncharacterized protein n=1 Tax=Ramularia collo-cygni TaxID=112498 RepID=A0A2D3UVA1_9PEZI|nr:uncharacterized protein RCC_05034 [Ramularia collo-cygni]CZT19188.1 uncharacterized protein RCC_05034 [Ramularia collo-cygni]
MPPQRPPSSPTSLLWAHQLKREHGYLLDRMKKLEAAITDVEAQTTAAAGAARSDDVAIIAKKVQQLTDDGGHAAMEKIRGEVTERFEDVGAEIEAVTLQISSLERDHGVLKEEGRRAVETEKALLKRIHDVEGSMREYERGVLKLGRKIDEQAIGKIREMLEGLSEDVKNDKVGLELAQASLEKLDEAGKLPREGNDRLAEQVKELAERPIPTPAPVIVAPPAALLEEPEEDKADSPQAPMQVPAPKPKTTRKAVIKAAPKAKRKPALRGAAADTQLASTRAAAAIKDPIPETQEPLIDARLKAPVVRRGKGWVEIEEAASEDENEPVPSLVTEPAKRRGRPVRVAAPSVKETALPAVAPVKRGPGRPRKDAAKADPPPRRAIVQPDEHDTSTFTTPPVKRGPGRPRKNAQQVAPAPRRRFIQPDETQPVAHKSHSKRPLDLEDDQAATEVLQAGGLRKTSGGTPEPPPAKKSRRGLTGIFTSPLSSSTSPATKILESKPEASRPGQVFQSETSQPDTIRVQPPKRRTIVQPDDETILRNYQAELAREKR